MKDENLKNLENAIASIEAYKSHLKDEDEDAIKRKEEKFKSLFQQIKKFDRVDIHDYPNQDQVTIFVETKARIIFWEYIIPNLPDGFFVKADNAISDDKYNCFRIKKIEKKNVTKDKIHNHLSDIVIFLMNQTESLFKEIPELAKIVAEESHNMAFDEEFKKRYDDYYYSDSGYISEFLCKISIQLEFIFKWEESLKKHLKDKYYKIKEKEKTLEEKSKFVEEKEKELAERCKNLELLKEHLDKMLVATN